MVVFTSSQDKILGVARKSRFFFISWASKSGAHNRRELKQAKDSHSCSIQVWMRELCSVIFSRSASKERSREKGSRLKSEIPCEPEIPVCKRSGCANESFFETSFEVKSEIIASYDIIHSSYWSMGHVKFIPVSNSLLIFETNDFS